MVQVLPGLSEALADTVSAAGAAVVRVEARRRLPASGVVWSPDGLIVTAHHVIEQEENIVIGLPNGQAVPATLVGRDPATDVAVLRASLSGQSLQAPSWADGGGLRVGHLVLALGRPGQSVLATLGIVSALGESWRTPIGGRLDRYLQTDVVMYPGFSGGPLVDAGGRILGVNTSALLRGIPLTVPTATVRRVMESVLAHGRVRRGYLGVGAQPVRLPEAIAREAGQDSGLLLLSVEAGGPADRGGLLLGDTIIAVNGQPVRHLDDLLSLLTGERIGATVPVRILRGGQVRQVSVVIGERS